MVFLRHADSELFEEAYFVMRRDTRSRPAHKDMVAEAERILKGEEENTPVPVSVARKKEKGKRGGRFLALLLPFVFGVVLTAALFLLVL